MIIVTNKSNKTVCSAAIDFAPGENQFKDTDLSEGKLAQISAHPSLKWVTVEDRPAETRKAKGA